MSQTNNTKEFTIPLILGEETRPKVEIFDGESHSVKIGNSIFYQQYKKALSGIAELIIYNGRHLKNDASHNNIFIFNGERGSGKTSCMLSVSELLCNIKCKEARYAGLNLPQEAEKILIDTSFNKVDVIDPVLFDDKHNILDLFIGILFKTFITLKRKDQLDYQNDGKRNQLFNLFAEVKRHLSVLSKTTVLSEYDDLEQLNDLAASMNFKQCMEKLVKSYIEYMYNSNSQLILCIDDIDLNMSEGYTMVEQIRKYLNIPGLIILMAVKIEQLANVIRIKYSNDFAPLKNNRKYDETINGIVERYITKLFPLNQRIQLPTVHYLLNQNVGIFKHQTSENVDCIEILTPLKEGLLELIYKKIRLLAYNTSERINYIIPRNLRELLNLVHLLYNMNDANDHKEAIVNRTDFKGYFYGGWCTNNLDEEGLEFMRSTLNIITPNVINQMVVRFLKKRFSILTDLETAKGEKDYSLNELVNILNSDNVMYNISLGDVLACLDWLDKVCDKEKDLKLLFAIKMFYTIALYENFRNEEELFEEKEKIEDKEIINRGKLTKNETSYGNIVNGNLFNSEYLNVAPYEKGEVSRCRRMIDRAEIERLWENGKKELVEFFMLTTSFVISAQDKDINTASATYRKRLEVYYEKDVSSGTSGRKNVCFDLLSVFYNLANVRKTYERFHFFKDNSTKDGDNTGLESKRDLIAKWVENTYKDRNKDFIKKQTDAMLESEIFIGKCPLYQRILSGIDLKEDEVEYDVLYSLKERELQYVLNIRNIEVLEQISYLLQSHRPDGNSNNIETIEKVFETMSKFRIQIRKDKDINMAFFGKISEYLNEIKKSKEKTSSFDKVFSDLKQQKKDGKTKDVKTKDEKNKD